MKHSDVTSRLDRLADLAEKATPGPYLGTEGCAVFADGYNLIADTFCGVGDGGQRFEAPWSQAQCARNAAFIAAMDPGVVLKLISVARAAVARLAAKNADLHTFKALQDAVDELEGTEK